MQISPGPTQPVAFERSMVFIDGSNVFPDFREANLLIPSFLKIAALSVGQRQLTRAYIYTTQEKLNDTKSFHGDDCFAGCRIVLGESVPLPGGKHREKGVDALLVADLIYHAAMKNLQYAVVISNDSDFAVALKRVEDFGCRTGLVSLLKRASDRLIDSCDNYMYYTSENLIENGFSVKP